MTTVCVGETRSYTCPSCEFAVCHEVRVYAIDPAGVTAIGLWRYCPICNPYSSVWLCCYCDTELADYDHAARHVRSVHGGRS